MGRRREGREARGAVRERRVDGERVRVEFRERAVEPPPLRPVAAEPRQGRVVDAGHGHDGAARREGVAAHERRERAGSHVGRAQPPRARRPVDERRGDGAPGQRVRDVRAAPPRGVARDLAVGPLLDDGRGGVDGVERGRGERRGGRGPRARGAGSDEGRERGAAVAFRGEQRLEPARERAR